jgi:hypothetical protein
MINYMLYGQIAILIVTHLLVLSRAPKPKMVSSLTEALL